jgi:acetyl esterase/lipase
VNSITDLLHKPVKKSVDKNALFTQILVPRLLFPPSVLLLSIVLASCALPPGENEQGDEPAVGLADKAMHANVGFDQVLALPVAVGHRRIAYGDDPLQFGTLWLAAGNPNPDSQTQTQAPTIVFIHGGCWLNAFDISHTYAASAALADAGFNVWSLEYRRTGDAGGGWPGTFADIQQGINQLAQLAPMGVSSRDVVLMGHSAGGHLALLAGSQAAALEVSVSRVIGLAAITDVIAYGRGTNDCQTAAARFIGASYADNPDAYRAANPASHGLHPGSLLLHGNADTIVPLAQTEQVDARVVVSNGAGHFDWVHPGTPAFAMLLRVLEESDD